MPEITVTDYDGLEVDAESRAVTVTLYDGGPGPIGPQGEQGEVGPTGPAGADGAPGVPGADGEDGASAYEVATANGFVGTEAAWLASLVGPEGQQGQEGPQGIQGPPGADGAPGVGVPTGGATGQLLAKNSATDYDTEWVDAPAGGGGGSELGWFVVTEYGATGDGATDDTSAVNAAIAALNSAGRGVLYFPAGHYRVTAGLTTITVPCQILGDGPADTLYVDAVTEIRQSSPTAHTLTIGAGANGALVQNLSLRYVGGTTPTAGSGIRVDFGEGFRIRDVSTRGFWINIDVEDGREWYMSGCLFYGPVQYGLRVAHEDLTDGGDAAVADCQFVALDHNSHAGIYQVSGGGLKVMNCKFNGRPGLAARFAYGIDISIAAVTGVLLLSNLSIENVGAVPLRIRCTSGSFQGIVVDGIQSGDYFSGTTPAIEIAGVRDVSLSGLVLMATVGHSSPAIKLTDVTNCVVGDRITRGFTADYSVTGSSSGIIDAMDTGLTTEAVQDIVDGMIVAGSNVTKSYDDTSGTLTISSSGDGGGGASTASEVSFTPTGSISSTNVQAAIAEVAAEATGGGGGAAFEQVADLPLTSLTGMTPVAGTWVVDTTVRQTDSAAAVRTQLDLSAGQPLANILSQVDLKVNSMTSTTESRIGFTFGADLVVLATTGSTSAVGKLYGEFRATAAGGSVNLPDSLANGTWITLRIHKAGPDYAAWVNGTFLGTIRSPNASNAGSPLTLSLYTQGADASFRNLKVWTPAFPA